MTNYKKDDGYDKWKQKEEGIPLTDHSVDATVMAIQAAVNHPSHYNEHGSGVECIDIVEWFNFNLGNAIKYIWRAGLKSDNPFQDLQKAHWYLGRELERLNNGKNTCTTEETKS